MVSGLLSALLTATVSGSAWAQVAEGFSANRFEPAERGSDWFAQDSLDFRGKQRPSFGTTLDFAYRPLVLFTSDGAPDYSVVKYRLDAHVGGSFVFMDRFRAGFSLPFALVNDGVAGVYADTKYRAPYRSPTVGDLRLGLDARIYGEYGAPFQVAAGMRLWLPTGDVYSYAGDSNVRWAPHVAVAGDVSKFGTTFAYAAKLHYQYRAQKVVFGNASIGNELGLGLALGARLLQNKLLVGPEYNIATRMSDRAFGTKTTPSELLLGAHYTHANDFHFGVAAGVGFTQSPGAPGYRLLASFDWTPGIAANVTDSAQPVIIVDRDNDGAPDGSDRCPDQAGPRSNDPYTNGCPDNDGDGFVDSSDACPKEVGTPGAEPAGCSDSDGDRVADVADACKMQPGVKTNDARTNGCPSDRDGDTITDSEDACPDVAGPKREGVGSGCPDADNDGIPEPMDACPDKPGTASSDPSKNGCPIAELQKEKAEIVIREQVRFKAGKAEIEQSDEGDAVLRAVLKVLQDSVELQVRIEGHTDNTGDARQNVELSGKRASAVVDWLIKNGIARKRLTAKGLGPAQPLGSNETDEGRKQNRRVEFHVTK
jgi:OmpA-OmpF porin, OOP family